MAGRDLGIDAGWKARVSRGRKVQRGQVVRAWRWLIGLAALGLSACAIQTVEFENIRAARELARQSEPPGAVQLGWRVSQQRCAICHGSAAEGTGSAPDLRQRLRSLGPHQFVGVVLRRYDPLLGIGAGAASDDVVAEIVSRKRGALAMPAWQGEPIVTAHVMDLYAYLAACSEGSVGPGPIGP